MLITFQLLGSGKQECFPHVHTSGDVSYCTFLGDGEFARNRQRLWLELVFKFELVGCEVDL